MPALLGEVGCERLWHHMALLGLGEPGAGRVRARHRNDLARIPRETAGCVGANLAFGVLRLYHLLVPAFYPHRVRFACPGGICGRCCIRHRNMCSIGLVGLSQAPLGKPYQPSNALKMDHRKTNPNGTNNQAQKNPGAKKNDRSPFNSFNKIKVARSGAWAPRAVPQRLKMPSGHFHKARTV